VVPYSAKIYVFYTRSTTYKKQGAPDQWSLIQQKSMFFTHVAPHKKAMSDPIKSGTVGSAKGAPSSSLVGSSYPSWLLSDNSASTGQAG
jgi:hypothetical protein